jgi:hypothetical protein
MSGTTPILNFTGATPFTLSATPTNTFTLNSTGATVNYTHSGIQSIGVSGNAGTLSYMNLGLSGSGTKTFQGATTVSSALTISTGVIANLGTATHSSNTLSLAGNGHLLGQYGGTGSGATFINTTFFSNVTLTWWKWIIRFNRP